MPSEAINFTKAAIENLAPHEKGKRVYYKDSQLKGLIVDVRSSSSKSFYVYKKVNGKPERIFLGTFPDLTVENARKKASSILGQIANGINPQEDLRQAKKEWTFGGLFEQYMERYSKVHKKSWRYDEKEIPRFLSPFFNKKLSAIQRTEVQRLHEKIYAENGLYQANRILERTRAMFNKAIEWGWAGTNPTTGIKKYKEKSRDRFIQPSEMPFIIKAINAEENQTAKDFLWMLLLTGARKTNTLMMRFEEINWERSVWRIPDTKNGEPVSVPLTGRAIEIIARRKASLKSGWVFPQEHDDTRHFVDPKRAWKRVLCQATLMLWEQDQEIHSWLKQARKGLHQITADERLIKEIEKLAKSEKINLPSNLLDIRLHDIRRTFGSYQAISGASLQVIGKSLGHKSTQATKIYARLNLDAVRASVNTATDLMFDLE